MTSIEELFFLYGIPIKFHRVPNYSNKAPTTAIRFLSILGSLFMLMGFVLMLIGISFV